MLPIIRRRKRGYVTGEDGEGEDRGKTESGKRQIVNRES
jgi:hypothetical protein